MKSRRLSPEEWQDILRIAPPMYRALYALMLSVGARINEVRRMTWESVRGKDGAYKDILRREKLKTRKAKAYISHPLLPEAIAHLEDWRTFCRARYLKDCTAGYIFAPGWKTRPVCESSACRQLKRLAVQVGIDPNGVSLHSPRKTYARFQYEAFCRKYPEDKLKAARQVQRLLGHNSLENTFRYLDLEDDNPYQFSDGLAVFIKSKR